MQMTSTLESPYLVPVSHIIYEYLGSNNNKSFTTFIIESARHTSSLVYVLSVMTQKSSILLALISSYFLQSYMKEDKRMLLSTNVTL